MRPKPSLMMAALTFVLSLGAALPIVADEEEEKEPRPRALKKHRDGERKEREHKRRRPEERRDRQPCKHEWKKLRVQLTPQQKSLVEAFKGRLNEQTRGFNRVVLRGILGEVDYILAQARREKQENPDIARLRELAKTVKAKVRWAHEELDDYRVSLFSPEQKKHHFRLLAAKEDHKKNCPHPPRPQKERKLRLADVEKYKQYGVFDCPPFGKEGRKRPERKRPKREKDDA